MNVFRKKLLINLSISLIIVLFLSGALVFIINDLRTVGMSIEKSEKDAIQQAQSISNLRELRQGAERAEIIINKLQNALPTRELLFVFSEDINRLARERNLTPHFTFGSETISTEPNIPSSIDFTMVVTGNRQLILEFIKVFEASRYFTRIAKIEMLSQGGDNHIYQTTLSGVVFFNQ